MLDIQVDLSKFRADMAQTSRALARGREDGLDRAAGVVYGAKQKQIGKTYARPIPKALTTGQRKRRKRELSLAHLTPGAKEFILSKKGRGQPLWKRTGNWTLGQRIESRVGERIIKTEGPAAKYEGRLANLPTGADGINRTNKASEEAHRITAPLVVAVIENAIGNALRALT